MIDIHIHGAFGIDLLTADGPALDRLAIGLEARGVSGFLPTLVPLTLEALTRVAGRLSAWIGTRRPGDGRGALPLGIHFEGPFVSKRRSGALHADLLLDGGVPRLVDAFFEAAGKTPGRSMVTLAPEIPGGIELIREFVRRDWVVSIGHTDAHAATLDAAFEAGARHMTHFGNAMLPLHHREVGPLGWGLLHDEVTVDVIADLHHLSADMLRLVWKAKGPERVVLISDAVPPAGLADGLYTVWGEPLRLDAGCVRNSAGNLAGSAALLPDCVARLASCGIPPEAALRSATAGPRRLLGL